MAHDETVPRTFVEMVLVLLEDRFPGWAAISPSLDPIPSINCQTCTRHF